MIKLFRELSGYDTGGPDPIPEDVRKKIEKRYINSYGGGIKITAAKEGYKMALPTIQAQEERIRVLEEALRKIQDEAVKIVPDVIQIDNENSVALYNILWNSRIALTPKTNNL